MSKHSYLLHFPPRGAQCAHKEIIKPVKCLCTEQHSPVPAQGPVLQLLVWPCLAHPELAQAVPSSTTESHFHSLCKPSNYAAASSQTILPWSFPPPLQARWRKMVRRDRRRLPRHFPWDEQQNNSQEGWSWLSKLEYIPLGKGIPCISVIAPLCIFPGSHFSPHASHLHLCCVW